MPHQTLTDSVKKVVSFTNDALKVGLAPQSTLKKDILSNSSLEKIKRNWPLQRGSVFKSNMAWNHFATDAEVINAFVAFVLKWYTYVSFNHSILLEKEQLSLAKIFCNSHFTSLFWGDVKRYYQQYLPSHTAKETRTVLVEKLIPHGSCVLLCLDATFFRLRSGANQELASFEFFIEDLYNANNSLIAFSRQKLLEPQINTLKAANYKVSFKLNKELIATTLQEALEPHVRFMDNQRFIEPIKTGCFDRLIDLLGQGQNAVDELDNFFARMKV